mgnify:CR=1 FL=1
MRHRKKGRKLGRKIGHRKALFKNLAKSLILYEKIKTTEAKAKEIRGLVERIITIGKKNDLTSRRLIIKRLGDEVVAKKVLEDLSPKYKERNGGYLRIIKIESRPGDRAKMARIEFV